MGRDALIWDSAICFNNSRFDSIIKGQALINPLRDVAISHSIDGGFKLLAVDFESESSVLCRLIGSIAHRQGEEVFHVFEL